MSEALPGREPVAVRDGLSSPNGLPGVVGLGLRCTSPGWMVVVTAAACLGVVMLLAG